MPPAQDPTLSPLQHALGLFRAALEGAKTADATTYVVFLDLCERSLASEEAARLDREPRP